MQSVRPHPTAAIRPASRRFASWRSASRLCAPRSFAPGVRLFLSLAALSLALVVGVGCASSTSAAARAAGGDLSYTSLSNNNKLRLVSDSWVEAQGYEGADAEERRAEFYGQNVYTLGSGAPAVKVCDDAVFDGVVQALDQTGFSQYAAVGSAAASGSGATQFLELSIDGEMRHFALTKGMSLEAKKAYQTSLAVFFDVFNAVEGFQSGDGSFQFDSKSKPAGN